VVGGTLGSGWRKLGAAMSVTTTTDQQVWQSSCRQLAAFAWERFAIKRDRHGLYSSTGGATWSYSELTMDELAAHFAGDITLGCGSISLDDKCLWVAWDLDNHVSDEATNQNLNYAIVLMNRLAEMGVQSLVEDSDGRGGIHVWVLFDQPVPSESAHRFSKWVAHDYADHLEKIECFPKSPTVQNTPAKCGNYVRLPGKHHKRDHWSRFYGDGAWLDVEESIQQLLHAPLNNPACLAHAPKEEPPPPREEYNGPQSDTVALVKTALPYISNGDYDQWLRVGQALHSSGDHLLGEWVHWSATSEKYKPGECETKWKTFNRGGSINIGTVFHLAAKNGWQRPKAQDPVDLSEIEEQAKAHRSVGDSPMKPYANGANADKFEPFPLECLPSVLRRFVTESASAIGCDPTMSVLPTLAVCASAIGTSRSLMIKRGWFVPSLIWTVVVGESGTQKTPPIKLALKPIKDRQKEQIRENEAAWAEFCQSNDDYKRNKKVWDKTGEGDRPEAPVEPVMPRSFVQDPTIESLAPILLENPRGLLLARDELSGWFGSFNQYSSGKTSTDVQKWLEIYGTESITIDRKTGDQRFIFVPHPSVSVCGGIQPDILSQCLTDENKSNGLQSRLLMAYPPRQPKRWRDDEVSESASKGYYELVKELSSLRPDTDISGDERPTTLRLTDDARQLYKDFVNQHGEEQNAMHGHLASQWSKLEEIPARLAIILHCIRQCTDGVDDAFKVDVATMNAALTLGEWFKAECLRINRLLTEPAESREVRRLLKWIGSRGGRITARDLCKYRRDIATSEEAEKMLIHLVSIGAGTWSSTTKSREFILTADNVGD
jgi:hypothetical protein